MPHHKLYIFDTCNSTFEKVFSDKYYMKLFMTWVDSQHDTEICLVHGKTSWSSCDRKKTIRRLESLVRSHKNIKSAIVARSQTRVAWISDYWMVRFLPRFLKRSFCNLPVSHGLNHEKTLTQLVFLAWIKSMGLKSDIFTSFLCFAQKKIAVTNPIYSSCVFVGIAPPQLSSISFVSTSDFFFRLTLEKSLCSAASRDSNG